MLVGWLEFNVPFQHKWGYIRDESRLCVSINRKLFMAEWKECASARYLVGLLDNSWIRQLADWTTSGLDISRTGQLADATGDFACLVFVLLAASARPRVVQSATCPVRELAVRELAYPRVVQLPLVAGCLLAVIVLM